ncbi:MAG: tyrosine-type recombinase/integrase [Stigonema ocellatum SAG 48.90 = DSM 106950]|nr:tyrosine-type recombinase/integrase [Stigonema ocellatum SAG 48.90 = DSM 106950]
MENQQIQSINFQARLTVIESGETDDLTTGTIETFSITCPKCSSSNYVNSGRDEGRQRYQCKDCSCQFLHPLLKELKKRFSKAPADYLDVYCYHCGSRDFVYKGKDELNRQRFLCNSCRKQFIDPKQRFPHNITCPKCGKKQCAKRGFSKAGKQKYFCHDCDYRFVENPNRNFYGYNLPLSNDVWDARELGVEIPDYNSSHTKFVFTYIHQPWLKTLVQKFVRYRISNRSFSTIIGYISSFNQFSDFLKEDYPTVDRVQGINRDMIIEFIIYLNKQNSSPQTIIGRLGALKLFFEDGNINQWFKVSPHLIRLEDYPKSKKPLPRYIPEEVLRQLNQHLDKLPEQIMRMVLVLQECGLRISEALTLPFDCLKQDVKGDWFIQFIRHKMKKEATLPISNELAAVIQEQQQYIQKHLNDSFNYLFCGRQRGGGNNNFLPEKKPMTSESFHIYLNRIAQDHNITDINGKIWHFQSHQFRHTVGTRMINNGVPQHIVQRYLGHESPTMTMRYAHIYDQTLKKEIAKYHDSRVVNIAGEIVQSENPQIDSDEDLQWMKKKILAQALPNGSCARPLVKGSCPHANACLTCGDFRTTIEFLDQHKEQLQETEKIIALAQMHGWQRQIEMNEQVKSNLINIINILEVENE